MCYLIRNMIIKEVSVLNEKELMIHLVNGECRMFNISEYLEEEVFTPLKDISELKKFTVEFGCIEWECGASLSEDTLLSKSIRISRE